MKDWRKVYVSAFEHKVDIVQAVLKEEEIPSVVMNLKDRAYLFGEVELYVHVDDVMKAKQIIQKESL